MLIKENSVNNTTDKAKQDYFKCELDGDEDKQLPEV